jgi:HK97 family phage prohead protease
VTVDKKTFAIAEVRAAESDNPNGEFLVILSAETLDRDGEVVDSKAFEPLPDSIPFHAFHDFNDPIGRGVPAYADDGTLQARGTFASTVRAQEIRTLVAEGVIGHTSVGFMAAVRSDEKDVPHVVSAELLEGSFVSVPSNREAAVLVAKGYDTALSIAAIHKAAQAAGATVVKTGARNSTKDSERLQTIHDLAVTNGAVCASTEGAPTDPATEAPETPGQEPGKSPASDVVTVARLRARAALLVLPD